MPNPFDPMRVDQAFNANSSYGPHEGIDCNVSGTSGNQDCGAAIKSISSGVCVHTSVSTQDYGKLAVVKSVFNGVVYFIRYCHLQELVVRVNDTITLGQKIGAMGSTGNSTACHLHLDILKKQPPSWRFYTKDIFNWFVDPIWFISNYQEDNMDELLTYLGVSNIAEAKNRLREHLGEANDRCNWGPEGDAGGFLGSARKDLTNKQQQIVTLELNLRRVKGLLKLSDSDNIEIVLNTIKSLMDGALPPVDNGSSPAVFPPREILIHNESWVLNGVEWSGGKLIGNYKRALC